MSVEYVYVCLYMWDCGCMCVYVCVCVGVCVCDVRIRKCMNVVFKDVRKRNIISRTYYVILTNHYDSHY